MLSLSTLHTSNPLIFHKANFNDLHYPERIKRGPFLYLYLLPLILPVPVFILLVSLALMYKPNYYKN